MLIILFLVYSCTVFVHSVHLAICQLSTARQIAHYVSYVHQYISTQYCNTDTVFAARCYASTAYVVMRCLSVCLSVCPSVTFVNFVKTNKYIFKIFHCQTANHSSFSVANGMAIF